MKSYPFLGERRAGQTLLGMLLLSLGLLLLPFTIVSCDIQSSSAQATSAKAYPSVSVRQIALQTSYEVDREFMGIVQAPQRVDLGFDSAGVLIEVLVEEGDWVEQGQKLAVLDSSVLQSELSSAKATKRDLNARLALNKKDLARQEKLREKNYTSESQRDTLASQQQSLRAQIQSAAASVQSLERQIKKKSLYAPFSAHVAARLVDKGVVVAPGTPVLELLESGALEARVGVPIRMARKLRTGEQYTVVVEGVRYRALLKTLGNSINRSSKTVAAQLEIVGIDSDIKLLDGQIVRLVLSEVREKEGAWVAVDSLVAGVKGTWDVYVLEEVAESYAGDMPGIKTVQRRKVSVEYIGGGGAYVSYGLFSGDLVVDMGIQKIAANQLVKVGDKIEVDRLNTSL